MCAWVSPQTWTTGQIVTADDLNTDIRDNMLALSLHAHTGAPGDGASTLDGLMLTTATLDAPLIADFTNAQHDHRDTDDGGVLIGLPFIVIKPTDEAVNNSDVLQPDDALLFAVGANETWIVDGYVMLTGPGAAGIKVGWSLPAGATHTTMIEGIPVNAGESNGFPAAVNATVGTGTVAMPSVAGWPVVEIHAVIHVGVNAGTATLQWAQNTATVGDSIFKADSYLVSHKVS